MIDFIERRCWEFLNAYRTEKIGDVLWFTTQLEDGWNKFMIWYYELVEESGTIRLYSPFQINVNNLSTRITFLFESIAK